MENIIIANVQYWIDYLQQIPPDGALSEADLEGAARALDIAVAIPEAWPLICTLTTLLHPYMERQGPWTGWDTFLHYLIDRAQQQADIRTYMAFLMRLGCLQCRRGNLQAAIISFRHTWRFYRQTDDQFWQAIILSNLGDLYCAHGDFWRAKVLCDKARTLFEILGDLIHLAYTENHLGWIALRQKQWDAALFHFQRAEKLFLQIKDENGLAVLWQNMGMLYHYMQQPQQALDYLLHDLHYYEKRKDDYQIATTYLNLGNTYRACGDFARAEEASLLAEVMFTQLEDYPNLARVRHNLGIICAHTAKWEEAERCFLWAVEYWQSQNDDWNLANTIGGLIGTYIVWGKWQKAQHYLDAVAQYIEHRSAPSYQGLQHELAEHREKLAALGVN